MAAVPMNTTVHRDGLHDVREQSAGEILHNGTVCFVDTGSRVIAVTADHVYRQYLVDRESGTDFVCQFGNITVLPESRLIDRNQRLDIATFDLPELIGRKERFLSNRLIKWPPPRLKPGDGVIYGGYPGAVRKSEVRTSQFPFETITGLVADVSSENIVLVVNYQGIYWPAQREGEELNTNPGGASGGPVYFVDETGPEYAYLELAGFISEYHAPFETILARHADVIRADGTLVT